MDASEDAAAWAMYNVARTGTLGRVRVLVGGWYDPASDLAGSVAGIISNPPYIRRSDLEGLQPEVCLFTWGVVLSSWSHTDEAYSRSCNLVDRHVLCLANAVLCGPARQAGLVRSIAPRRSRAAES